MLADALTEIYERVRGAVDVPVYGAITEEFRAPGVILSLGRTQYGRDLSTVEVRITIVARDVFQAAELTHSIAQALYAPNYRGRVRGVPTLTITGVEPLQASISGAVVEIVGAYTVV